MSSAQRKTEELRNLNAHANDDNVVIKSPFYNDATTNPCIKEQNLSAKCALDNHADREICLDHMENYSLCMKFWSFIKFKRWKDGEKPYLPPVEEREEIKKKFSKDMKMLATSVTSIGRLPPSK